MGGWVDGGCMMDEWMDDIDKKSESYIYTCLLVWSDIESKGDKLSSSAECRIRTQGLWNRISSRLNGRLQTDWVIEDQTKKTWTQ